MLEISEDKSDAEHACGDGEHNESDGDICENAEIQDAFNKDYRLLATECNNDDKNYILHMEGKKVGNEYHIAAVSSEGTIDIYALNNNDFVKINTIEKRPQLCIGISNQECSELMYLGYKDCIQLCDLRVSTKIVSEFKDTTIDDSSPFKPQTCFDNSKNNYLLASGTELHEGDPFILFWDIRKTKLLGAYWESHTDDITQIKFHPTNFNSMITSSIDGLINIFNLQETAEDDALQDSLNVETAIEQLKWLFNKQNNEYCIFSMSDMYDMRLWNVNDTLPFLEVKRNELGLNLKRKSESYGYVASGFNTAENDIFIIGGSNYGNGECLRSFKISKNKLEPLHNFLSNEQRVRATWFEQQSNILVTGGEKNLINVWKLEF